MKNNKLEQMYEKIKELRASDIELFVHEGKLNYKTSSDALNDNDMTYLKDNKNDIIDFLSCSDYNFNLKKVVLKRDDDNDCFDLTDVQQAYMLGREEVFQYGGVSCHLYMEIEYDSVLNLDKVRKTWDTLFKRHEMLRMYIGKNHKQTIAKYIPYDIIQEYEVDENNVDNIREQHYQKNYDLKSAPLFDIGVINMKCKSILFLSFDLMIADWRSIWRLIFEFEQIYFHNNTLEEINMKFKDHVRSSSMMKKSFKYFRDKEYWINKIPNLQDAPQLSVNLNSNTEKLGFTHYSFSLDNKVWHKIVAIAKSRGVTTTTVLLSVYSLILRKWSNNKDFTLNLTMLNREYSKYDIDKVVGDFTGITLLDCKDDYGLTFFNYAKELQETLIENLEHSAFSGIEVIRAISSGRNTNNIIMPYVFTSGIGFSKDLNYNYVGRMNDKIRSQTPQVFIDCQCMDDKDCLRVFFDVRNGIFDNRIVDDIKDSFLRYLYLLSEDETWDRGVFVSLPEWHINVINSINEVNEKLELKRIDRAIYDSCLKNMDKIALVDDNNTLTYSKLLSYAYKIKKFVGNNKTKRKPNIGICMKKSVFQIATVVGVLLSGSSYVPIEIDLPDKRKEEMARQADVDFILNMNISDNVTNVKNYNLACIFEDSDLNYDEDQNMIDEDNLDDTAYVIFTSGSTGLPKGVEVSHRAAMNTIMDINNKFSISENDVFIGISKLSFDLSVYDIFSSLSLGATLIIPNSDSIDPEYWCDLIKKNKVSVWNTVPAIMQLFVNYMLENEEKVNLRKILLSGDWIPTDLPDKIRKISNESTIVAMGGATEASIWSNYHICKKNDIYERSIPYGVTLSNQSMYVLDYRGEYCPVNVDGDLYIGGDGLAKGYINNEELTSASFIYVNGIRLYKTGDIAKILTSGEIEFLGRKDRQVKINGFRVELGEIEVVLNKLDLVKSSVALLNDNGVLSCLIVSDKFEEICEFEIKEYLRQYLPEYMIPKIIIIKAKMPLTSNGKVDYKSLKKDLSILEKEIQGKDKSFIDDKITNALVDICKSNLKTEQITANDNLYNLGADSLIIAQIASNIRDYINDLGIYEYIEFDKLLRELINKPEIYNLRSFIEKYKIFNIKDNIQNFEEDDSIGQMNYILDKDNEYLQVFLHAGFGTLNCYRYILEDMKKENMSSIVGFTIKNSEKYCSIDSEKLISRLAEEYSEKIEKLGKKKIQIIGYCISGLIAVEIAKKLKQHEDIVCSIVLIDSHPMKYKLDDDVLTEILFLPSLGINFDNLGFEGISGKELFEAMYVLYNKFNKHIPKMSYKYLEKKYSKLSEALSKLDDLGTMKRFEFYSEKVKEVIGNAQPIEMHLELYRSFKHSLKAATYMPNYYVGDINFLLADTSSSFIPDEDLLTIDFWEKLCLGEVNVSKIPGDHVTCAENVDNAVVLSKKIIDLLKEM